MRQEHTGRTKIGYRDLRTQKEYLKLIAANVINRFGDSIDSIAFTWLVYAITGNVMWSAVIFGANQLPTILLQPFTGAIVENWNKKRLMVLTDLIRGGIVAGFAALYLTNLLTPWLMLLFTVSISTVEAFRVPAGMAFVPRILERRLYEFGTGLNSTLSTVMQLAGMAAAGVIIGRLGVEAAIFTDAVTFFLSAGIISLIRYRENKEEAMASGEGGGANPPEGVEDKKPSAVQAYFKSLKEGFAYIKKRRVIVNFCILAFVINGLLVPLNALQAPLVTEVLGQGSEFLSLINIMIILGMGLSSFLYPYLRKRLSGTKVVIVSGVILGICYLGYPLAGALREQTATAAVALVSSVVIGASVGFITGVLSVELMKAVEESYLSRCVGLFGSVASAAMPITSALISLIVVFVPVSVIFIACGALSVVLFISTIFAKMKFEAPDTEFEKFEAPKEA